MKATKTEPETFAMTEAELEERCQHSHAGGKHATLQYVVGHLRARAGTLFTLGKDDLANEVRDLASMFEKQRVEASHVLQVHIDRSMKQAAKERGHR